MKRLGVNIDHVATLRNARGESHPNPVYAAKFVRKSGADSVTIHLREDRRHINDFDAKKICSIKNLLVNLEISTNSKIVKKAHDAKVSVEGEIGFVGYANGKSSEGTLPNEAIIFAKESNVDAMAISVGNTHLQTNKIAKIDFDKIKAIQNSISTPLVLHGGSGIPNSIRKKLARETNIAKFNIGTELRMTFGKALRKQLKNNPLIYDRLQLLNPTMPKITKITKKIIKNFGPL